MDQPTPLRPETVPAALSAAAALAEDGAFHDAEHLLQAVLVASEHEQRRRERALCHVLLAQIRAQLDDITGAQEQARLALNAARQTGDRDLNHRCMALLASLDTLWNPRL